MPLVGSIIDHDDLEKQVPRTNLGIFCILSECLNLATVQSVTAPFAILAKPHCRSFSETLPITEDSVLTVHVIISYPPTLD